MSHDHHHHTDDAGRIGWAFVILLVFLFVELLGGLISGSLALIADAGHMASDTAALGISWLAIHIGRRPADAARSFGYRRLEVLAAFVNGCMLFALTGWILFEAAMRLMAPAPVLGPMMLGVAVLGLIANFAAFLVLNGASKENLNTRSAWLHVLGDTLGFAVAIVAALIIVLTGWMPIDPLLSVVVALLILKSAWDIVRASSHILLQGTPSGLDAEGITRDLVASVPGVSDVHHVHIWSLTAEQPHVTLHARACDDANGVVARISARLHEKFGVAHATIQIDDSDCPDEDCARRAAPHRH
ncbi:MAG: cation diffusion facilitator family transporter [Proteobacteria bacterium]|nr:cation diffusion facilitator family transporter [Pseudomonadota bacterium]